MSHTGGSPAFSEERKVELLRYIIQKELAYPPHEAQVRACPHCGAGSFSKRGHDAHGRQRYQCRRCSRSFTASTGNMIGSTNIPLETWLAFASCHVGGLTLRQSAAVCGVSLATAFNMRHRLVLAIHRYSRHVKRHLEAVSSVCSRPR